MDIRFALKRQYHAGFAMLRECVEKASEEIWVSGDYPRNFWRIAYHVVFFTHLYLGQTVDDFVAWEKHRDKATSLWADEKPEVLDPYSQVEVLGYLDFVDGMVDSIVDGLDLECENTGIPWYKNMGKLEHEILNIRHLQTHVGQLSERLIASEVEGNYWVGAR